MKYSQNPFRHIDYAIFPYFARFFDLSARRFIGLWVENFVIMSTNIRSVFAVLALLYWKIKRFGELYQFDFGDIEKVFSIFAVVL